MDLRGTSSHSFEYSAGRKILKEGISTNLFWGFYTKGRKRGIGFLGGCPPDRGEKRERVEDGLSSERFVLV